MGAKLYTWTRTALGPFALALAVLVISAPMPAAQAGVTSSVRSRTILVLGDSLSAGLGLDPSQAYPALLQKKIDAAHWKDRVINAGVSGDTSADGLARVGWLMRQRIDVLILELGGNDGLRGISPTTTKANLQAIIDRVRHKYPQVRIVIAGMKMPPNLGRSYTDAFQKIYPELAAKNHTALIPFLLAGVGGNPELNQADHIHPTAKGQEIVANNVWKVLRPLLAKTSLAGRETDASGPQR